MNDFWKNKSILIRGGTGSLGKKLTHHILTNYPDVKRLVIYSRDEQKQFIMAQEFPQDKYPQIRYFIGDVNIGSEEMVTINQLAQMAIDISEKSIQINNIQGEEFVSKYVFKRPVGVRGRNSDNKLYKEKVGWEVSKPLYDGMKETFTWINKQVHS